MRLSITLSDFNHSMLKQQAYILGISLSKHISNLLQDSVCEKLSTVEEVLKKLGSD